ACPLSSTPSTPTLSQRGEERRGEEGEGGEEKKSACTTDIATARCPRREHHDADEPEVEVQEPRQDTVDDLAEPEHEEDAAAIAEVDAKMGTATPSHADGASPPSTTTTPTPSASRRPRQAEPRALLPRRQAHAVRGSSPPLGTPPSSRSIAVLCFAFTTPAPPKENHEHPASSIPISLHRLGPSQPRLFPRHLDLPRAPWIPEGPGLLRLHRLR
ncbi:unnamed protein product, partial [Urochloa humidicola]